MSEKETLLQSWEEAREGFATRPEDAEIAAAAAATWDMADDVTFLMVMGLIV
ncbi:hypothetical protein [Sporomusa sp.]|uniref:hypothetical protein n=1 Tax=Sporomusa sp. TaxID=2078658 RepID=UPI002B56DF96|nr:hypothetical protein [Sporomusa sp.]HWR42101.1 hypothetical protein [Sporomusa sp.]